MATKDKCYDPGVNLCSDEDDGDMNNAKLSPSSSPPHDVEDVFVYNNLRKGGPLNGGDKKEGTDKKEKEKEDKKGEETEEKGTSEEKEKEKGEEKEEKEKEEKGKEEKEKEKEDREGEEKEEKEKGTEEEEEKTKGKKEDKKGKTVKVHCDGDKPGAAKNHNENHCDKVYNGARFTCWNNAFGGPHQFCQACAYTAEKCPKPGCHGEVFRPESKRKYSIAEVVPREHEVTVKKNSPAS